MEKIIDDFDSRKRAEEIYSRRNGANIETDKTKYCKLYKFLFQILVLINMIIAFVFYYNRNSIFNADFLNQVNDFYNINVTNKLYEFFNEDNEIKKSN